LNYTHADTQLLISENSRKVDLIIPRGGERLIRFVQENASVPVIVSGRGNNFLYVEGDADFNMATRLILNGKQRISVCNAIDKIVINQKWPHLQEKVTALITMLTDNGIEVWGSKAIATLSDAIRIEEDAATLCEEYLAPKLYLTLADDINEAIGLINNYSGGHSAVIVTNSRSSADRFMQQVDCAAVYHNASSRFTDGGQYGVGAEIAISTQKLHFRGPLGAQELVTNKWFVYGEGHIRE
jgi:glutamate-5-semialdehyde dehydrogenase